MPLPQFDIHVRDHETYPTEEIIALYGRRWEIEINIRHLKETMNMHELHCKTVEGVKKELLMFALAYNFVRMAWYSPTGDDHSDDAQLHGSAGAVPRHPTIAPG